MTEERRDIFDSITPRLARMTLGGVIIGLLLLGIAVKFGRSFGWIDGATSDSNPSSGATSQVDRTITIDAVCERLIDSKSMEISWAFGKSDIVRIRGLEALATERGSKLDRQVEATGSRPEAILECGAKAQKWFEILLTGQPVELDFPFGDVERDADGRMIPYVHLQGKDLTIALIERGWALACQSEHPRAGIYQLVEQQARRNHAGIHSSPAALGPRLYGLMEDQKP